MKKLSWYYYIVGMIILLSIAKICYSENEWREGDGTNTILGTETVSDIDAKTFQNIVDPLDRLLGKYQRGATVTFNSTTAIDITLGEISCQNSGGTITRMRANTSTITLTSADLDVGGAFANSSTYSVYGVADADAATFTGVISLNSSTPDSGAATYFKLLGTFGTDGSGLIIDGSITAPVEDPDVAVGTVYDYGTSASSSTSKTTGTFIAYGALTVAGDTTSTISNLPFGSSSTFQVVCSVRGNDVSLGNPSHCKPTGSTTLTLTNSHNDSRVVSWVAVGF